MNQLTSEPRLDAKIVLTLAAGFFLISILHFSSVNNELNGLGGDNARYILVAKSMASGQGYLDFAPGDPLHIHYPPIFPLLLTPLIAIFGVNFAACHILVVATELIALVLLFFLFKNMAGWTAAIFCTTVFALNIFVNLSLVRILSEFPYLMVTCIALLLAVSAETNKQKSIHYLWLPIMTAAAYLTRTAGLSFLVGFFLYRLYRKDYKLLCWNLPLALGPYLGWYLWQSLSPGTGGYFSLLLLKSLRDPSLGTISVSDFFVRIFANIQNIAENTCNFLCPLLQDPPLLFVIGVSILILSGFSSRLLRKELSLLDFYLLVYLAMLLVWPVYEPRKLMPVAPFLFFYFFVGLQSVIPVLMRIMTTGTSAIKETTGHISQRLIRIFCILCILFQFFPTLELLAIRSTPHIFPPPGSSKYHGFSIDWSHYREAYYWIKGNAFMKNARIWSDYLYLSHFAGQISPPETHLLARKPTLTALYSQRRTTDYPMYNDLKRQNRHVQKYSIDYILFDGFFADTYNYLLPFIQANPDHLKVRAQQGRSLLIEVLPGLPAPQPSKTLP